MKQIPLNPETIADSPHPGDGTHEIASDLAYQRLMMVNVIFFGRPGAGDRGWVLIDAGLTGMTGRIERAVEARFGADARPAAIILTHGHFDHVGCLEHLAEKWDAPIYAHGLEFPYLNGTTSYPPPDPTVGGGVMPLLSPLFPRKPTDVTSRLRKVPEDGSVPGMPGWRWIHTPGHAPGHISLWRENDRALIVGDAFITTDQESAYAIATQAPQLHGPPTYFTPDWASARRSVVELAALQPSLVVAGHGRAMHGAEMLTALQTLAARFEEIAVPKTGRYVVHPPTSS